MGLIHKSVETIDKTVELYITVPWPQASRVVLTAYPSLSGGWIFITFSIHHVQIPPLPSRRTTLRRGRRGVRLAEA